MSQSATPPRLHCLDWIRVIAFGLLIVYHVETFYYWSAPGTIENKAIGAMMLLTHPWRTALLFVVAGASFRFIYQRAPKGLIARQSFRLGAPLLLGLLLLVPAQFIVANVEAPADWSITHWLTIVAGLDTSRFRHLWFIAYLLAYTVIWAIGLRLVKRMPKAPARQLSGWVLVIGPLALLALLRALLVPQYGETHDLLNDWYGHSVSFAAFIFGYALAGAPNTWATLIERRTTFLACAVLGYAGVVAVEDGPLQFPLFAMLQWGGLAAVLGYGAKFCNRQSRTIKYLNGGVLTALLVHEPITATSGYYLLKLKLPLAVEAIALIAVTAVGSWLCYEAVRRAAPLCRLTAAHLFREPAKATLPQPA
ncbi:MAG: acyltransferase family protein [Pseudomonadota bacterium]